MIWETVITLLIAMRWTLNNDDNDKLRLVHLPITVIVSLMVDAQYHRRHLCGKNAEIQIYLMTNAWSL